MMNWRNICVCRIIVYLAVMFLVGGLSMSTLVLTIVPVFRLIVVQSVGMIRFNQTEFVTVGCAFTISIKMHMSVV